MISALRSLFNILFPKIASQKGHRQSLNHYLPSSLSFGDMAEQLTARICTLLTRGTSGLYFQVSGCPNFQNPAKPASNWLEKKVAGGIYLQNTRDELQLKLRKSSKTLQKLCTKLRTKLCKSSTKSFTKGFAAPLPTQCAGRGV
jgi:hypothetical protein